MTESAATRCICNRQLGYQLLPIPPNSKTHLRSDGLICRSSATSAPVAEQYDVVDTVIVIDQSISIPLGTSRRGTVVPEGGLGRVSLHSGDSSGAVERGDQKPMTRGRHGRGLGRFIFR